MADGLAKSAESVETKPVVTKTHESLGIDGDFIDPDVYSYFNTDPIRLKEKDQLKSIVNWAKRGTEHIGQALLKIRDVEQRLGAPQLYESRIGKIYNWVTVKDSIASVNADKKQAMKVAKNKAQAELANESNEYVDKIKKLNNEIRETAQKLKQAKMKYKLQVNNSTRAIKDRYANKLRELKDISAAHQGGK